MPQPSCALVPARRLARRTFALAAAALLALPAAPASAASEPHRVLLLNSYHPGYQWTDDETRGVLDAIGGSRRDVQVYTEYMGTKWTSDPAYFGNLRQAYAIKFQRLRFDVIVATDDDALAFLLEHGERLFGRVPIVFCGVNDFHPEQLHGRDLVTGVNELADFRGGLDLALRLHPGTRRIVVISDSSVSGVKIRKQFERVVPDHASHVQFEFLGEGPVEPVLERVRRLPPDALVFHLVWFSDASGRILTNDETASLVSRASPVPVYGGWQFSLGHGIVGGKLLTGYGQGFAAGEMARRILGGERVEDIPVLMSSTSQFMFDDVQLRRFGISRSRLPPGSVVINAPPSFYALNKSLVWSALGGLTGLLVMVAVLLVNGARRRRAEEALRRSEEKFRTLVGNLPLGVFRAGPGPAGRFLQVNPAMERLLGRDGQELTELAVAQVYADPGEHGRILDDLDRPPGLVRDRDLFLRRVDGALFPASLTATARRGPSGAIAWIDGTVEDVTDRKRMEAELLRTQNLESVGLLAGGIAHDFNNLLTGVMGNLSLAVDLARPRAELLEPLADAQAASERARELTNRLLTFACGGAPTKKPLAVEPLVRACARLALSGSSSGCTFELPPYLAAIDADEVQMTQVLNNLLLNAAQAMPHGGVVTVRARDLRLDEAASGLAPGRYVEISVRDGGVGIPRENLGRIFDPFFTTKQRGRGLGLSTAYSIVKQHGGRIEVESTPGAGSTFTVILPASCAPAQAAAPAAAPGSAPPARVLVMDDEPAIQRALERMLRRLGHEVCCASDGDEAIRRYRQALQAGERFDLVIMDLTVPAGMGGKEAVREVLAIDGSAQVLVSSGYSDDPIMANPRSFGFAGGVAKPYGMDDLARKICEALGGAGRIR